MAITLLSFVESVEKGSFFLEWKEKNKAAFLSSMFIMAPDPSILSEEEWHAKEWLLSYYDPKSDSFTTFCSSGEQRVAKEQAFTKDGKLERLELESVKLEVWACIKAAEKLRKDKHKEEIGSLILILQPLNDSAIFGTSGSASKSRPVWNLTYITKSYNILNIKIDATSGIVLSDTVSGVMEFMQDGNNMPDS
jgi:hypothetical protein